MLIAEELEVDVDKVVIEHSPPDDKVYVNPLIGIQMTGGSTAIRAGWEPMRRAGATARVMLVSAAAARWGVEQDDESSSSNSYDVLLDLRRPQPGDRAEVVLHGAPRGPRSSASRSRWWPSGRRRCSV